MYSNSNYNGIPISDSSLLLQNFKNMDVAFGMTNFPFLQSKLDASWNASILRGWLFLTQQYGGGRQLKGVKIF